MSGDDAAAKTGKIAVWWDMKDCPVTEGIDAHRVRPSIEGGFRELGYSGPVSIKAYGDQKRTPDHLLQALSSTGVAVVHIRSESTCALMYKDMVKWREDNLPPATMMIITNQILDVFHWDLARLQQRTHYDLFLAYSVTPRAALYLATREVWLWEKLLLGTTTSTSADTAGELSRGFHCKSCSWDYKSVKSFKAHFFTGNHAHNPTQLRSVTSKWGKNYAATPENATAKILVCWDMFDCPIPGGYDPRLVRPSLEGAFKELGYSGPVSITAYGDHKQTSDVHLQALSTTGIDVAHVIPEKIFSLMYDDLMDWQDDNPAPAIIMLISDAAVVFLEHILALLQQQQKYNLFWAYSSRPREMSIMLTSAEWLWDRLLAECSGSIESVVGSTRTFYCKLCYFKCKRLDKFMNHLSSQKHISVVEQFEEREKRASKRLSKRLKKAIRCD